jgi:hypothetical protein
MKKTLLGILFCIFGLAAQAQFAYTGNNGDNRAGRSSEVTTTIQVFPNPATEYFNVSSNQQIERITVYNLLGREMKSFTFTDGDRYFIGDLSKGMYLVQMTGKDNRLISTQRLSKR